MRLDRGVPRGNDVQPMTTGLGDSQQLFKGQHLILNMLENLVRDHEIKRVVLIGQPQVKQAPNFDLMSIVADEGSAVSDVITTSVEVPASPQSSHSAAGTTAEIEYLGRLGKVDAQRREDGEVYPNGRIMDGLPLTA